MSTISSIWQNSTLTNRTPHSWLLVLGWVTTKNGHRSTDLMHQLLKYRTLTITLELKLSILVIKSSIDSYVKCLSLLFVMLLSGTIGSSDLTWLILFTMLFIVKEGVLHIVKFIWKGALQFQDNNGISCFLDSWYRYSTVARCPVSS